MVTRAICVVAFRLSANEPIHSKVRRESRFVKMLFSGGGSHGRKAGCGHAGVRQNGELPAVRVAYPEKTNQLISGMVGILWDEGI